MTNHVGGKTVRAVVNGARPKNFIDATIREEDVRDAESSRARYAPWLDDRRLLPRRPPTRSGRPYEPAR